MLDKIEIVVTKTSNGLADYVQISSPAAIPVNIVLVAGSIVVKDHRPPVAVENRDRLSETARMLNELDEKVPGRKKRSR